MYRARQEPGFLTAPPSPLGKAAGGALAARGINITIVCEDDLSQSQSLEDPGHEAQDTIISQPVDDDSDTVG